MSETVKCPKCGHVTHRHIRFKHSGETVEVRYCKWDGTRMVEG